MMTIFSLHQYRQLLEEEKQKWDQEKREDMERQISTVRSDLERTIRSLREDVTAERTLGEKQLEQIMTLKQVTLTCVISTRQVPL